MRKWLMWTGLCLMALGVGVSWAGHALGGETAATIKLFGNQMTFYSDFLSFNGLNDQFEHSLEQGEGQSEEDRDLAAFDQVEIDVSLGDVTIVSGDTYGVELRWWGGDPYRLQYANDNGTLRIWSDDTAAVGLPMQKVGGEVLVFLPDTAVLQMLHMDVDMGNVNLRHINAQRADLTLSLGDLDGTAVSIGQELRIDSDLGDVSVHGDLKGSTVVDASMGDVELHTTGASSDYQYDLECSLGSILIDRTKQNNEHVTGGRGGYPIAVTASLGDIALQFDA